MSFEVIEKLDGKFEYAADRGNKVLRVTATGTYTQEETDKALAAFSKVMKQIIPTEYTVQLNFGGIDYVDDDRAGIIIQTFQLYQNAGFPRVLLETPKSSLVRAQLEDSLEDSGLHAEFY